MKNNRRGARRDLPSTRMSLPRMSPTRPCPQSCQLRRWLRTETSCSGAARRGQRQRGYRPLAAAENGKVPKLLVKLASACVNLPLYPQASVDALSASFGNFDRVVALGWLIADAVRLPLLSRAEAYAVGLKARREAGNIKSDEAGDKKAASRLAPGDPKRGKVAELAEKRLQALVELPLPAMEPAAASGSRKRARQPESAEPSHEQVIAYIEAEELDAQKAIKKAEAAVTHAEKKTDEKEKVVRRLTKKVRLPGLKSDAWFKFEPLRQEALAAWNEAVADEKDAEIALLEARLEASELANLRLGLDWEHAQEGWDESMERGAKILKLARAVSESRSHSMPEGS